MAETALADWLAADDMLTKTLAPYYTKEFPGHPFILRSLGAG